MQRCQGKAVSRALAGVIVVVLIIAAASVALYLNAGSHVASTTTSTPVSTSTSVVTSTSESTSRYTSSLPHDFAGVVANVKCGGASSCGYLVHLPTAYDGKQPFPLLLAFQPSGGTAEDFRNVTGLDQIADRLGFIVIYPDQWDDGADTVQAVSALLDTATRQLNIDSSRIYAVGQSLGGLIVQRLACHLSARIAGIAMVTTDITQDLQAYFDGCAAQRPIAVLAIHGTSSAEAGLSAPDVRSWAAFEGCAATPRGELPTVQRDRDLMATQRCQQ